MIYVGMDISSKSFVVHAINAKKKLIYKGEIEPTRKGLKKLDGILTMSAKDQKLYIFEAGNQMKWIADAVKKLPNSTRHIVHPNEIKWISQSSGKTDKIDAKKLAELGRADMLPRSVHVVEGKTRQLREMARARVITQSKRIAMMNTIRGFCKQEGHPLPVKFFQRDDWRTALLKTKLSSNLRKIIEGMMPAVDALLESEADLTGELCLLKDKRVELVETIPAIGPLTARVIVGALDNAERFDNKKSVAKYGALTPRLYQSGDTLRMGRIANDGRHEVRRVLLQCAHCITRMKSHESKPLRDFYERVEKRSGKKRAVVALSRKLLTTAYGVLKTGKPYDPQMLMPNNRKAA